MISWQLDDSEVTLMLLYPQKESQLKHLDPAKHIHFYWKCFCIYVFVQAHYSTWLLKS